MDVYRSLFLHEHEFGLCSRVNDNALIWIPKNATDSIRSLGYKDDNFNSFEVKEYWAILRDPYSRWKSGILELLSRKQDKINFVLNNLEQVEFDEHTVPQSNFLPIGVNINFVSMNLEGIKRLEKKLKLLPLENNNNSKEDINKAPILTKLEKHITPIITERVKEYYAKDYYLLNKHKLLT